MMSKTLIALAVLSGLIAAPSINAQTKLKADDQYVIITYFSVPPENQAAYEALVVKESSKIYQKMIDAPGSNLWAWNFGRFVYNGVHGNPATHVGAAIFNGPPPDADMVAAQQDEIVKGIVGTEATAFRQKLNGMRKVLGVELVRGIAWAPGETAAGQYRTITYLKNPPNKAAEYRAMIRDTWQPIWAAAVADNKVTSWSSWSYVFPRGASTPYSAISVSYFKDVETAIKGTVPTAQYAQKLFPDRSFVGMVDSLRSASTSEMVALTKVLATIQKSGVTR